MDMNDLNVVNQEEARQKSLYILNELDIYEMNHHKSFDKNDILKEFNINSSTLNKALSGSNEVNLDLYKQIIGYLGANL